jgi:hypothetical protein
MDKKFPNVDNQLPSAAKAAITDYLYARILDEGYGYTGKPLYTQIAAHLEANASLGGFVSSLIPGCYEEAVKRFDQKFPVERKGEDGRAIRPLYGILVAGSQAQRDYYNV